LRLLINTQGENPLKFKINQTGKNQKKNQNLKRRDIMEDKLKEEYRKMVDQKHPNCMAFDSSGKLYVGDSSGGICSWRVNVNYDKATLLDFMKL